MCWDIIASSYVIPLLYKQRLFINKMSWKNNSYISCIYLIPNLDKKEKKEMVIENSSSTSNSPFFSIPINLANPILASTIFHPQHHLNLKEFITITKPCPPKTIGDQLNPIYISVTKTNFSSVSSLAYFLKISFLLL